MVRSFDWLEKFIINHRWHSLKMNRAEKKLTYTYGYTQMIIGRNLGILRINTWLFEFIAYTEQRASLNVRKIDMQFESIYSTIRSVCSCVDN